MPSTRTSARTLLCAALLLTSITACTDKKTERPTRHIRIVSLSPTATEILYAIGAGDSVVAVDGLSDYPAAAKRKSDTRIHAINTNVTDVMRHRPDLVVITDYASSNGSKDIIDELRKKKVKVAVESTPDTLPQVYASIQKLGKLTDHSTEAEETVTNMREQIDDLVTSTRKPPKDTYYYHELDNSFYSAASHTFMGSIYAKFNLRNIADRFDLDGTGYPKLTSRQVISANPDLIFLADTKCCGQNLKTIQDRPGWNEIKAVQKKAVVELDDDIASRWGPRLVEFVRQISEALEKDSPA